MTEAITTEAAAKRLSIPGGVWRSLRNAGNLVAKVLLVCTGNQGKRREWAPEVLAHVAATGRGLGKNGYTASAPLLPMYTMGKS